jgi:RNA polymerase sigma factor (sigma-70 family)
VEYGRLEVSVSVIAPRRSARSEDDRALARRAGRGDQAAFAELYGRHASGLLSFVQQYVGDRAAAEDVVQQTFLAAFHTLSSGTAIEHPRAWLFHVARNNALTVVRDRRPAALEHALEDDLLDRAAAVPAQIEQREALEEVVRDIVALPAQQRAALALFEIADLSQAEIAEVLDCTPAQVKALVYQARTALVGHRDARSASCTSVRERMAAARGGALNQRGIRHHLRHCEPCTAFRNELRDRRRRVALLLPVLPAPGLRDAVLGAFETSGHTAAGAGAGASTARPGRARWIAGGTTATAAAVGVAWLAWPGAPQPNVQTRAPAAAAAPATRIMLPAAQASTPPARASRASRSDRRRPHAATTATARPAKADVRDARAPAAAPLPAEPAPTPRSPVRAPAPRKQAPPAPGADPPARADPPPRPAAPAPSPPPAATPSPAAATTPAVTPAPAAPAPVPAPPVSAPPCTDHSHASEQGLKHGKGHHKC